MRINDNFRFMEVADKKVIVMNIHDNAKQIPCDASNFGVEQVASYLYNNESSIEELVASFSGKLTREQIDDAIEKLKSIEVIEL